MDTTDFDWLALIEATEGEGKPVTGEGQAFASEAEGQSPGAIGEDGEAGAGRGQGLGDSLTENFAPKEQRERPPKKEGRRGLPKGMIPGLRGGSSPVARERPVWQAEDWDDHTGQGEPIPMRSRHRTVGMQAAIRVWVWGRQPNGLSHTANTAAAAAGVSHSAMWSTIQEDGLKSYRLAGESRRRAGTDGRADINGEFVRREGALPALQCKHDAVLAQISSLPPASSLISRLLANEKALRLAIDALSAHKTPHKGALQAPVPTKAKADSPSVHTPLAMPPLPEGFLPS